MLMMTMVRLGNEKRDLLKSGWRLPSPGWTNHPGRVQPFYYIEYNNSSNIGTVVVYVQDVCVKHVDGKKVLSEDPG